MIKIPFIRKTKENNKNFEIPFHTKNLNEKNFYDFIEKYPVCFINFWAPWCTPCKKMTPRMRRLSKIFEGKVAFGKVNTQKNNDITKKYNIMSIPTFILFKNSKEKANFSGTKSVGEIKKIINNYL